MTFVLAREKGQSKRNLSLFRDRCKKEKKKKNSHFEIGHLERETLGSRLILVSENKNDKFTCAT